MNRPIKFVIKCARFDILKAKRAQFVWAKFNNCEKKYVRFCAKGRNSTPFLMYLDKKA